MALSGSLSLLGPIERVSLGEKIAVIISRLIFLENLSAGTQLPSERDLAATLGVSHRVIREALGILVGKGIIAKEHGRGAFVQSYNRARLEAELALPPAFYSDPAYVYETCFALEVGAMAVVVEQATEEDLAGLQAVIDQMQEKAVTGASTFREDLLFHQALLQATHNDLLQDMSQITIATSQLIVYYNPGLLHRTDPDRTMRAIQSHQAIVDAIRARDHAQATLAMLAHTQSFLHKRDLTFPGRDNPVDLRSSEIA